MAILIDKKNKLYVDNLNNETITNFNNLVKDEIKNRKKGTFELLFFGNNVNRQEVYYDFEPEDISIYAYKDLSEEQKKIIKLAKSYFDKAGLNVNEYKGRITFTSCKYDSHELIHCPFGIHTDNEEFEDAHTCIFYTQIDEKLKGGDLDIYLEYTLLQFIGLESMKPLDLGIKTGSVVVFDGNLFHSAQPCSGFGYRNHIIVNLYRKRK